MEENEVLGSFRGVKLKCWEYQVLFFDWDPELGKGEKGMAGRGKQTERESKTKTREAGYNNIRFY